MKITHQIWLDDERPAPAGWTHVRTEAECIQLLRQLRVEGVDTFGIELSLDHDLGPPEAGTGYGVLAWIEEEAHRHGYIPPRVVRIHTLNPVGRERMYACLASTWRGINNSGVPT